MWNKTRTSGPDKRRLGVAMVECGSTHWARVLGNPTRLIFVEERHDSETWRDVLELGSGSFGSFGQFRGLSRNFPDLPPR